MARVTEIACTISRTYNLGNYQSLKVEWSETVHLDSADNYDDTKEGLKKAVGNRLDELYKQERPNG